MNSYLLESSDYVAQEAMVKKIIREEKFEDASISIYDMEEVGLASALEDLDTYGFLSSKKVVVIRNIEFLRVEEEKDKIDHLLRYLSSPEEDKLLIIEAKKLNHTLKVTKELKKRCRMVDVSVNSKSFIKESLKGYKISQDAITLLDEYCLGDITKIKNECWKLKEYRREEKEISLEDVKEMVVKKLGDSKDLTFSFSRSLALRDRRDALEKYRELLNYNIEPLGIIGLLGSQIRIIYQVKILAQRRLSDREIANILEEKEFRIKKTRELIALYQEEELLKLMQKLSDIDLKIKSSDVDPNLEIELFITSI